MSESANDANLKTDIRDDAEAFTAMAEETFAEDWDSPEDAVYDRLHWPYASGPRLGAGCVCKAR